MRNDHSRLGFPLFVFGLVFAVFHVLPAFLRFPFYGPLSFGDLVDLFTPLTVMSALYLVYKRVKRLHPIDLPSRFQRVAAKALLAVGGLMYVDGHGIHLPSNAIGRLVYGKGDEGLISAVYYFDEILSHYIWETGVILISLGLLLWSRKVPVAEPSSSGRIFSALGGILFGFTFFANGVEGQTVPLSLPAAGIGCLLALLYLIRDRRLGLYNPVAFFFMVAYLVSAALFLLWAVLHPGFPQFSDLGWI